jgi:O-antigen/teichoic acid export membrane protein
VDAVVTATLYPAICRVRDRLDLLFESFVKSNRLALMWGVPFGVGVSLFAADLVEFGLGDEWAHATVLLQVFGAAAAIGHIGFNWDAFYRARGDTRPIAVWSALTTASFLAIALPLLFSEGLNGFAWGIAAMTLVSLAIRCFYLMRLFSGLRVVVHALRAVAPTAVAAGAVLLLRLVAEVDRGAAVALGELGAYLVVTALCTAWLEQSLLREVVSYLRGFPGPRPRAAT